MTTLKTRRTRLLSQSIAAVLFTGVSAVAMSQTMTLQNNQLQISAGSGTTFSNQTPTISSAGVVATISDVPTTDGVGIPSFNFTIVPDNVGNGTYDFRVAVVFVDASVPNRRMEAEIETITLNVQGGVITGTIPNQTMRVLGRNGAGTLQVDINVTNQATNGPVTVTGGTVSLNAANLISRIRSSHNLFDTVILAEFNQPATYDYRIVVQQKPTQTIQFGTGTTFNDFPMVKAAGGGCSGDCVVNTDAFDLGPGGTKELAADYTSAYTVTGRFNVKTVTSGDGGGGGGGGTPTPTPSPSATASPTATPTPTPSPSATASPTATPTPTPSPSATASPTATPTPTPSPSATASPTATPTPTPSPSATASPTATPAATITTPPAGTSQLTTTVSNLTGQIPAGAAPITGTLATSIVNAFSDSTALSNTAVLQAASLTTTAALTTLTSITSGLDLAGTAQQRGVAIDTTAAASTIDNVASVIAAITGSRTLTPSDVREINTVSLNALTSASLLITDSTSSGGTKPTTASILAVVQASSNILAEASKASGAVVSPALAAQVTQLATIAVDSVISNLSADVRANADLTTNAGVQAFLRSNPVVLNIALEASVALPANATITVAGQQLTRAQIVALTLSGGGTTQQVTGGLSFLSATTAYTVTTDSVTGNMTLSSATEKYVAAAPQSRLVPASVPGGISYLPDGTAVLVGNGVATELAPTAFDSAGFRNAVTAAGYQLTYRDNGTVSIALANNERFSGAFAFDNLGTASACGSIGIASPTGNPASAGYSFTVVCANGPQQRVTPIADSEAFYTSISDAGLNVSTDRNTGIVTILTIGKLKPSFFVTPLTSADTTYFNANKNSRGVAFRSKDANGDGRLDYDVITATGVQLFYGMP